MYRRNNDSLFEELNKEIHTLSKEYARLKNISKPFEAEIDKDEHGEQFRKYRDEKRKTYGSFGTDLKKKREYVLELRKEVADLKVRARKDELEQKLIDQYPDLTVKELLELLALNNILLRKETT